MANPKDVVNNILALLKADLETKQVEWHKGRPPKTRWNKYPFGWVEWNGGPIDPRTAVSDRVKGGFFIVVVCQHMEEDKAEDEVMDLSGEVKSAVKVDRSLLESVDRSWFTSEVKEKTFADNYSIVAVQLTLSTIYYE